MKYSTVAYTLGRILAVMSLIFILPLAIALIYEENLYLAFVVPFLLCAGIGALLTVRKPQKLNVYSKEGIIICGLAWIILSVAGSLPYIISGAIPRFVDAFFEAVSGFTTTGSSVLTEIESLPRSILFFRSFTNWVGGMGILTLMIALVPKIEGTAMNIMKAEVPGPKAGKIVSKTQDSVRILYVIYSVLTLLEIVLLLFGKVGLYNSVVISLANAGTGGFCVLNNSILGYGSAYVEWICIIFMFIFGVNFNLFFFFVIKKVSSIFKDEEFRAYIGINVVSALLIFTNILSLYKNIPNGVSTAFRDSFFAVNTVMSTTGFCTADFNTWPTFSKTLLLLLMFVGGSVGSTGGGMKVSRIVLYFKQVGRYFRQLIHPHSVSNIKANGVPVDHAVVRGINGYLCAYFICFVASVLVVSVNGYDITTTFTSVVACFNNIGPGLELVGPTGNFALFSDISKIVLSFDMLVGRLELFPILLLFYPSTWKKI